MKKIWINKEKSFRNAEKFDREYYLNMRPEERLETMQILREINIKMEKGPKRENRKRLRRSVKIIQQK
ncbi:hypothetical protein ACFLQ8_00285 [Candidatus Auribacterota bacterium]